MLSPFTLQLKETNGQQKAQAEIYSKDALTCHLGLQTLLAYLSFFFLKQQISLLDVTAMWQNKEASCNLASSTTGKAQWRRWFCSAAQQAVPWEVWMLWCQATSVGDDSKEELYPMDGWRTHPCLQLYKGRRGSSPWSHILGEVSFSFWYCAPFTLEV